MTRLYERHPEKPVDEIKVKMLLFEKNTHFTILYLCAFGCLAGSLRVLTLLV